MITLITNFQFNLLLAKTDTSFNVKIKRNKPKFVCYFLMLCNQKWEHIRYQKVQQVQNKRAHFTTLHCFNMRTIAHL